MIILFISLLLASTFAVSMDTNITSINETQVDQVMYSSDWISAKFLFKLASFKKAKEFFLARGFTLPQHIIDIFTHCKTCPYEIAERIIIELHKLDYDYGVHQTLEGNTGCVSLTPYGNLLYSVNDTYSVNNTNCGNIKKWNTLNGVCIETKEFEINQIGYYRIYDPENNALWYNYHSNIMKYENGKSTIFYEYPLMVKGLSFDLNRNTLIANVHKMPLQLICAKTKKCTSLDQVQPRAIFVDKKSNTLTPEDKILIIDTNQYCFKTEDNVYCSSQTKVFNPCINKLFSAQNNTIFIVDLENQSVLHNITIPAKWPEWPAFIEVLAFNNETNTLFAALDNGSIKVLKPKSTLNLKKQNVLQSYIITQYAQPFTQEEQIQYLTNK